MKICTTCGVIFDTGTEMYLCDCTAEAELNGAQHIEDYNNV